MSVMVNSVDQLYDAYHGVENAMRGHMPTLRRYAASVDHVTEFGVRTGVSTVAFLCGRPKRVVSYDIDDSLFPRDAYVGLAAKAGVEFVFHKASSLAVQIEPTDLLFLDSLHTYDQLRQELALHAHKARRYLVFHDTESFAERGEDGSAPGLRQAIAEFMADRPEWRLKEHFETYSGLSVYERA